MEDGFEVVNLHGCASGVIPTPTIGTNGNWFVGNKDTDVAARGADGAVGEQGPQGLKGDQGEIGPAGPQGIQGIQGEKGEKGDQGIQGETGDQGEKGDQGIQGIQGEKGEKGDQGIQGIQGEKGDQGEKGTDADVTELKRLSGEIDTVNQSFTLVGAGDTTYGVWVDCLRIMNIRALHIYFTGKSIPNGSTTSVFIPEAFRPTIQSTHPRLFTNVNGITSGTNVTVKTNGSISFSNVTDPSNLVHMEAFMFIQSVTS